MRLLLR